MADNDLFYLQPDFDPTTLTVPRLRSILVQHEVAYPSSAKKSELVDIFNNIVTPQATRVLNARARTKRSTRGISDVPSSAEPSVSGDDTDSVASSIAPPASTRRTPRARGVSEHSPPRTTRSTRSTRASVSLASESEAESSRATPAPHSRTRYSATPMSVRDEDIIMEEAGHGNDVESPFTQDNPFQSDLVTPHVTPMPSERRRRTLGHTSEKKAQSSVRRKTDFPVVMEEEELATPVARVKTRKSLAAAVKKPQDVVMSLDGSVEPGEEFTPEEQMDLELEDASNKAVGVVKPRPQKHAKKSNNLLTTAILAVSLAILGGVATLWRQEKIDVGYCDVGRPSTRAIAGIQIPEWAASLRPQCEPCPPHAYCYSKMRINCETDFIMQPHPLSLGGLIPLPPTCEADGEKARKVKAVADRAVEELRERNAKWECGELRDAEGKREQQVAIQEPSLKSAVSEKRRKGMSQDEFEDLWHAALGEIMNRDEIVSSVDGASSSSSSTPQRTLRSTSLARVPFSCAVRRSLRLALARHLRRLVLVGLAILGSIYARSRLVASRATDAQAKRLASLALDRLAAHAALAAADPARWPDAYVGVAQLRDDVLRDEFSPARRRGVWDRVASKVEANANVRAAVREGRSGEVGRVWEWVGAVAGAGGDAAASGAVGVSGANSPAALYEGRNEYSPALRVKREDERGAVLGERKRWDEGRPVY